MNLREEQRKMRERSLACKVVRKPFRINTITKLWLSGLTYAEIGRAVGVTRQRVQQLIRPSKKMRLLVEETADYRCQACKKPTIFGHIHHIERCENFNAFSNLEYLCVECHRQEHAE